VATFSSRQGFYPCRKCPKNQCGFSSRGLPVEASQITFGTGWQQSLRPLFFVVIPNERTEEESLFRFFHPSCTAGLGRNREAWEARESRVLAEVWVACEFPYAVGHIYR